MYNYTTLEILKQKFNTKYLAVFINILNRNRIILDEQKEALIALPLMEKWDNDCTQLIINNGYDNPAAEIRCKAVFRDGYGAVYALYDSFLMDESDAKKHIEQHIEKNIRFF